MIKWAAKKAILSLCTILIFDFDMESSRNFLENTFICEICEEIFSTRQSKTYHITVAHKEIKNYPQDNQRNFKCGSCGKSYRKSHGLKTHIKIVHEGQKYKCNTWGKYFTQLGTLKIHIKTLHEGERNYKCDSCIKFFTGKGDLKKHINAVHQVILEKNHLVNQII